MNPFWCPARMVRHPSQPDWGLGQVQSVIGERVTVNFEDRGKVLINAAVIELEIVERRSGRAERRARGTQLWPRRRSAAAAAGAGRSRAAGAERGAPLRCAGC